MGLLHCGTTGCVPNADFSGSPVFDLLFNSFCFVSGNLRKKKSHGQDKPHVISTEFDTRFEGSDTVITNPLCSCCKRWNINKHNKYCQKNKNKNGQTKNPELHGCFHVFVCACVYGCVHCVRLPCDSLDELEIYNTGFYRKTQPKTVIPSPLLAQ